MNKRNIKNIMIITILVIYIIFYKLFIFNNFMQYSQMITASFLTLLLVFSIFLFGFRKSKKTIISQEVMKLTIFWLILTFILMYGSGIFLGFLKNGLSLTVSAIFENFVSVVIIIIFTELLRYIFIWANRDKKKILILFSIILIIFELALTIRTVPFNDIEELFKMTASIILPVIIKNSILSYLCYYVGYKVPLVYRLVMDTYMFILPIFPDLGEFIQSIILIVLPFIIYINSFTIIDERNNKVQHIFVKSNFTVLDIPIVLFVLTIIILVSGIFPHYIIGIVSDSMSPKINRGDAVLISKSTKKLKKGDIIAYEQDGKIVVHRIVKINKKKGTTRYITKGDANNTNDKDQVLDKQINGIVKMKIPYVAYPTIWIKDFIN